MIYHFYILFTAFGAKSGKLDLINSISAFIDVGGKVEEVNIKRWAQAQGAK